MHCDKSQVERERERRRVEFIIIISDHEQKFSLCPPSHLLSSNTFSLAPCPRARHLSSAARFENDNDRGSPSSISQYSSHISHTHTYSAQVARLQAWLLNMVLPSPLARTQTKPDPDGQFIGVVLMRTDLSGVQHKIRKIRRRI